MLNSKLLYDPAFLVDDRSCLAPARSDIRGSVRLGLAARFGRLIGLSAPKADIVVSLVPTVISDMGVLNG